MQGNKELIWFNKITCEQLNKESTNTLIELLAIKFIEVGDDYLAATMPVNDKTRQPYGVLHGGASCVLAETLASIAGCYVVNPDQQYCVGLEINGNHLKQVKSGLVKGITKKYHLGSRTQVWGVEVFDESSQLCFVSRVTMCVLSK
jgi:1,4-dihydroxy-2-naphthoyl-CoA hydrolase